MRYLLLQYDNDRKHIFGEINTMLNTSSSFGMPYVIDYIEQRVRKVSELEQRYSVVRNLLEQAVSQLNTNKAPEGAEKEEGK